MPVVQSTLPTVDVRGQLNLGTEQPACPLTAATLREMLLSDLSCRRRWLRHTQRSSTQLPNQAGVAWVLALALWERGDVSESAHTLPRSLKDRVSRALAGRLISASTLSLFVDAFDMSEDQEDRLFAAWRADHDGRHLVHQLEPRGAGLTLEHCGP